MVRELGKGKEIISQRLTTLITNGYVEKKHRGIYALTVKGVMAIAENPSLGNQPLTSDNVTQAKPKRTHNLGLIYHYKDELDPTLKVRLLAYNLEVDAKVFNLKPHIEQAVARIPLTVRITSKSMVLYAPELYARRGQPQIVIEAQAKAILDKEAIKLEAKAQGFTAFKLRRIGLEALDSEIVSEEIADEHHPLAEATTEDKSKIVLARHPADLKERLIADRSKGFKELETPRAESAGEDNDTLDEQFNKLLDGEIKLTDIPRLKQASQAHAEQEGRILDILERYGTQLNAHLPVLEKMDRVEEQTIGLNEKQAKLQEQQYQLNQKLDCLLTSLQPKPKQGFWGRLFKR